MSSKATSRTLQAGESTQVLNDRGKPLDVVLQTQDGGRVRTTLAPGARIDFTLGRASGRLFLLEPERPETPLRVVPR